jgi:hypothetical protein
VSGWILVGFVALSVSCTSTSEGTPPSPIPLTSPPAAHPPIKDAVASLGATCSTELWSGNCKWQGIPFLLAVPPTWRKGVVYRRQLCNHLVVDTRMLTDGRRWWIATRRGDDLHEIREALVRMDIHGTRQQYCP